MNILIVEDNEKNLKLFRDLLRLAGHDTVEAGNGLAAVEIAVNQRPDLILMDIQLPYLDGLEAARIIREKTAPNAIPIVAVTGRAMKGDQEELLQQGFVGYLAKPIDTRTFVRDILRTLPQEGNE